MKLCNIAYREDPLTALVFRGHGRVKEGSFTPCLASPQPQVSYPRAGPPPPSLIHMVELGFVGLLNNPKRIFAQLQKLEGKFART